MGWRDPSHVMLQLQTCPQILFQAQEISGPEIANLTICYKIGALARNSIALGLVILKTLLMCGFDCEPSHCFLAYRKVYT